MRAECARQTDECAWQSLNALKTGIEAIDNVRRVGAILAKRTDDQNADRMSQVTMSVSGHGTYSLCSNALVLRRTCPQLQAQGMYAMAAVTDGPCVSPVPPELRCPRSKQVMSDPVVGPHGVVVQRDDTLRKAMQAAKAAGRVAGKKTKKTYLFEVSARKAVSG